MNWLVKEEPTHYGFDALVKDKKAVWSGVRNALAQKHLRAMKTGDRIFYYHTGDEKAVVGIAKALSNPYPDPEDPSGKYVAVDVAPVKRLPGRSRSPRSRRTQPSRTFRWSASGGCR
jgi:predicted RNA-binding protein with PUA-like domain